MVGGRAWDWMVNYIVSLISSNINDYTMTDESLMPFGKYKREKLANVPAHYLLWLYHDGLNHDELKEYIEDNMDALLSEANPANNHH